MNLPFFKYRSLLVTYLQPQRGRVAALTALLLGSIALQLLNPQLLGRFIDGASTGASQRSLVWGAALFIVVALAQQVLAVGATYISEYVGWTAMNALRADLALHCLRLDMQFHKQRTPGELIERIDGDVTVLANFFTQLIIQVLGNILLLFGVLAVLWATDWRVGGALALFALITLVALYRLRGIAVPYWTQARQASASLFGFIEERLAGTEDIRSSGAQNYVLRRLYGLMDVLLRTNRRAEATNALTRIATHYLFSIGSALGLALGAFLFLRGSISIGTVYLISYYMGLLTMPLEQITRQVQDLQKASASIARINELYATSSNLSAGAAELPQGALGVAFEQVSFGYADEEHNERVLHDIAFTLEPSSVLGLLGRTGSGKTTLTRLLFRLYDPSCGSVRLAGTDIRQVRPERLCARVGIVTQDVQLFQASVRDNLTFFDPLIADERILRALDELGLTSWVSALPHGLDTLLSGGGGGLSAGQAQLLAFARVFLKDPGLVILDEASSRLDPATEQLIERALDRLLRGRTAIIIAHRLHTVQRADAIMILDQGRVIEYGERPQLVADRSSRFAGLLQTGLEEVLV